MKAKRYPKREKTLGYVYLQKAIYEKAWEDACMKKFHPIHTVSAIRYLMDEMVYHGIKPEVMYDKLVEKNAPEETLEYCKHELESRKKGIR